MYTITFNSKTSPYAVPDEKFNHMFIRHTETHLNVLLEVRGYMYMSTIYEALGVRWNPIWDNLCLQYEPDEKLRFGIRGSNGDGFDIDIH